MPSSRQRAVRPKVETVNRLCRRIEALAGNLWWTWNAEAQDLFAALDPATWTATGRNPLSTLRGVPRDRLAELAADGSFLERLAGRERDLADYLRARAWFERTHGAAQRRMRVAYFCAEFALHESLPIYSGGLGVLAGDHLKSASDLGVPLVAVGLFYHEGYYRQAIAADGSTLVRYPPVNPDDLPLRDTRRRIRLPLGRGRIAARIWQAKVGRVDLLLLDTDLPDNRPADRAITRRLYGGDTEMRIRQEVLLGVGGALALEKMKIRPTVYHLNEGHAAFCALHRLAERMRRGEDFDRALRGVRGSGVFTTHTPVPAGHDRFDVKLAMRYLAPVIAGSGLSRRQVLELGSEDAADPAAPLCMTALALRLSERCNGVAKLHGEVSRRMWKHLFGAARDSAVPIGHVTNGVHSLTWLAPPIQPLYEKHLKPRWVGAGPEDDCWARVDRIPADEFWRARCLLRRRLVRFVRGHLVDQAVRRGGGAAAVADAEGALDENALTIGFARRFATYKRAPLIFHDAARLARLLGQGDRPVQIIFAGKAHPADRDGQEYLRKVVRHAAGRELRARVAVLENYDMHIGRMLTSGCDVWLNNPLCPNEASGTSGMKPPLHGGVNLSVLDGWWPEAHNGRNGWAIGGTEPVGGRRKQDAHDAACIYDLLEKKAVPAFYRRGRDGVPGAWVKLMRESMRTVCARFSAHRMVGEYVDDYYVPSHQGGRGSR